MPKADEPPVAVELKACPNPWCEAMERDGDYSPAVRLHHFGAYRVVCTSCVLEGPLRPTQAEAIAAWNNRPAPQPVGREASEYISPDLAEVAGIVAAMHTKWMQREELMREPNGGFSLMERMADLLDGIVDAVPELSRKLQRTIAEAPAALSGPAGADAGERDVWTCPPRIDWTLQPDGTKPNLTCSWCENLVPITHYGLCGECLDELPRLSPDRFAEGLEAKLEVIARELVNQDGEPWMIDDDAARLSSRLHFWRDKAIKAAAALRNLKMEGEG